MAMFFKDDYIRCPSCSGNQLIVQNIVTLEPDKKEKGEYISRPMKCNYVCQKCGAVVKSFDPGHEPHVIF